MVVCAGQLNPSLPSGLTLVQNFLLETKQIKKKETASSQCASKRGTIHNIQKKKNLTLLHLFG